jgi:hypothetical protein
MSLQLASSGKQRLLASEGGGVSVSVLDRTDRTMDAIFSEKEVTNLVSSLWTMAVTSTSSRAKRRQNQRSQPSR